MKVGILLIISVPLLVGCSWNASIGDMSSKAVGLKIASPIAQSFVIPSNMSAYSVSGFCEEPGATIFFSGAGTGSSVCSGGSWSRSFDFSTAPDGVLALNAHYTRSSGETVSTSISYIKDTVPPSIALSSFVGGEIVAGLALRNITWTASDNRPLPASPVKIEFSSDNGSTWTTVINSTANSSSYAWMVPAVDSTDCLVRLTVRDAAGNVSTSTSSTTFAIDSSPPQITLESLTGGNFVMGGSTTTDIEWSVLDPHLDANSIEIFYSKDNGAHWTSLAANVAAAPGKFTWPLVPMDDLDTYRIRVTARDTLGNLGQATSSSFTVDSTNPSISSVILNNNVGVAGGNVLGFAINAADNFNVISAWRLSSSNDFSSSEWQTVEPTNFTFPYSIGISNATLWAQVRDAAGNVSAPLSSNMVTVTMGMPPTLIITYPTESQAFTVAGQTVHVSWKATLNSSNNLLTDGVSISYSLDSGMTVTAWPGGGNLSPFQNGGCTLDGDATGCVNLTLPMALVNEKFSIIVNVKDEASNSSAAISTPQNISGLKLLAGKNASVLGQTGLAFSLEYLGGVARDPLNGDLLMTQECQIIILKASTGLIEKWAGSASTCSHAGDGSMLSQARFVNAKRWAGGGGAANIVFDSHRNVFWSTEAGIWKYDRATGLAALYVAPKNMPYSNASGTDRLSFSCDSAANSSRCTNASYLEIGVDDTLYFAVDTQANPFSRKLYKVTSDDKVVHIAGVKLGVLPLPTPGVPATSVGFRTFSVVPDKVTQTDRIVGVGWGGPGCVDEVTCSQNGLWEVLADGTVELLSAGVTIADSTNLTRYIPSRKAIGYMTSGPCRVSFVNPFNPAEVIPPISYPTDDCDVSDVADGGDKGLYYTNTSFTNLWYTSSNNTPVIYSGNNANSGDGGLAILSQVRSPRQVTMGTDGTYYFVDIGNSSLRKVLPNGNLQTIRTVASPYGLSLSNGTSSTVYVVDTSDSNALGLGTKPIADINDIAAGSQFFAAPWGTKPVCSMVDTATNAKTELTTGAPGSHGYYSASVSVDGTDTYIYFVDMRPGDYWQRSTVKKVASDMSMTTVAGDSTAAYSPNLVSSAGMPVLTSSAGETSCNGCGDLSRSGIKVAGGVIFRVETNGYLYSADSTVGSNVWTLMAMGLDSTFALNPVTKDTYYFKGRALYRKPYVGAEVLVADFNGALKYPIIQNFDLVKPNTVILVDGDSIYTYTNIIGIP